MKSLMLLLVVIAEGGCVSSPQNGALKCGPDPAHPCPNGYHCAPNHTCWQNNLNPSLDLAAPSDMRAPDLYGPPPPIDLSGPPHDLVVVPDLVATVGLAPPAPVWTAASGGSVSASSGNELGVSLGSSIVGGTARAPSGAVVTFGYFSSDTY